MQESDYSIHKNSFQLIVEGDIESNKCQYACQAGRFSESMRGVVIGSSGRAFLTS